MWTESDTCPRLLPRLYAIGPKVFICCSPRSARFSAGYPQILRPQPSPTINKSFIQLLLDPFFPDEPRDSVYPGPSQPIVTASALTPCGGINRIAAPFFRPQGRASDRISRSVVNRWYIRHEAHVPAERPQAETDPWFPGPHGDQEWPPRPGPSSGSRAQAPLGLNPSVFLRS